MLTVVFVIAVLAVGGTTAVSTVTAECASGPVVNLTITGATVGYTVYGIGTGCVHMTVAASPLTYTMDTRVSGCTFKLGTAFKLVIQRYFDWASLNDEVFTVTCNHDMTAQVLTQSVTTTMLAQTTAVSDTFKIPVTFAVTTDAGTQLTTATVGDNVNLNVSIPVGDNAAVGFWIRMVYFKAVNLNPFHVIHTGCPYSGAPMAAPGKKDTGGNGVLLVSFKLFYPVNSYNGLRPVAGSTAALTIEVTLELCNGNCTAVTCSGSGRKRRSANEPVGTDVMTLERPLIILPPGMSVVTRNAAVNNNERSEEMPTFSTALIATVVALGVVLTLCILVLVVMVCRLRRHVDARDSKKSSFENKAYN